MLNGINVSMFDCILQLGGSGLAVFWRNQPIPEDDKDDFKEWKNEVGESILCGLL